MNWLKSPNDVWKHSSVLTHFTGVINVLFSLLHRCCVQSRNAESDLNQRRGGRELVPSLCELPFDLQPFWKIKNCYSSDHDVLLVDHTVCRVTLATRPFAAVKAVVTPGHQGNGSVHVLENEACDWCEKEWRKRSTQNWTGHDAAIVLKSWLWVCVRHVYHQWKAASAA